MRGSGSNLAQGTEKKRAVVNAVTLNSVNCLYELYPLPKNTPLYGNWLVSWQSIAPYREFRLYRRSNSDTRLRIMKP